MFSEARIVGVKYERKYVVLDNFHYENCEFFDCQFLYSGGPFVLNNCRIERTKWIVQGGAAIALSCLSEAGWKIQEPTGTGAVVTVN